MARLTDKQRDMIISDFNIGVSQNQLALKYECSPATINKLCKGLEPKYKDKVNTVVSIKSELSKESEYQSECFDKEVNDKLRRQNLVFNASEKALKKLDSLIDMTEDAQDMKHIVDSIDKASITLGVNQRHANSQVNISNTNATQVNNNKSLDDFYEQI